LTSCASGVFNTYIRKPGFVEPLAAKFCNGTTTTCAGLSQWGSQDLAKRGMNSVEILRYYYGDSIELVTDAPIRDIQSSYPGYPLRRGMLGPNVTVIQVSLNLISRDYPAIPKIPLDQNGSVSGIFDEATEQAVRKFQEIFNLTPDGIVGKATWYKIVMLHTGILRLSELSSQGQRFYNVIYRAPERLQEGDRNEGVRLIQYMLSIVSEFYDAVPAPAIDGVYGPGTSQSVRALQQLTGLPQTGAVDEATWKNLYRLYAGITETVDRYTNVIVPSLRPNIDPNTIQYPGTPLSLGSADR